MRRRCGSYPGRFFPNIVIRLFITAFTASTVLIGCSKSIDPNSLEEIKLEDKTATVSLLLPAGYRTEVTGGYLAFIRCRYPDMSPLDPNEIPSKDDIAIWIDLSDGRHSRAEYLMERAIDQFDPKRPGLEYRAEKQEPYDVYRHIRGKEGREETTYVFKANDGQWVEVQVHGDWSGRYTIHRNIGSDLRIMYAVAKPIGKDFIHIDEVVTDFITRRIKSISRKK